MSELTDSILRDEFPQAEGLKYLNHAAVAPWPNRTRRAILHFADENVVYGASRYQRFNEKEKQLRRQLAGLINAPSDDDVALMKSTSEALSVVASGVRWQRGDNVVTAAEEFPSNWIPWDAQKKHGVSLRRADLRHGRSEQALMDACDRRTRVLTVSSVQFSSGIRLNLEQLGEFCRANNILFCVDAIQSVGAHAVDAQAIQADFLMADGHKWLLAPEGLALFYSSPAARDRLELFEYGWHMTSRPGDYDARTWQIAHSARRFEPGSNNMLGAHALSASLSLFEELGMPRVETALRENAGYLMERLARVKGARLLTPADPARRAGIIAFHVDGVDLAGLHRRLLQEQVICALRGGAIRFSPHCYTSADVLDESLRILDDLLAADGA